MKTNIKMRVTPEQSEKVQKIVFANGGGWIVSGKNIETEEKIYGIHIPKDLNKGMYCSLDSYVFNAGTRSEEEVDADLFIRTNGTCEETKTEENKMEWIPFLIKEDEDLTRGNDYLVTDLYGERAVMEYRPNVWKQRNIKAYMELPEPYRPKTLKDRLDEAVEKYCYEFSDEEWENENISNFYITYNFKAKEFYYTSKQFLTNFEPFNFRSKVNITSFINSFTTEELMQIMKGEVR